MFFNDFKNKIYILYLDIIDEYKYLRNSINIFLKSKSIKKYIKIVFIFTILGLSILFIPNLYLKSVVDNTKIKESISLFISKQPLQIFYNGFTLNFYKGITLFDIKVVYTNKEGAQINLLKADNLTISFSIQNFLNTGTFTPDKIYMNHAKIFWKIDGLYVPEDLISQVLELQKTLNNLSIDIENSYLELEYIQDKYDKMFYTIQNFDIQMYLHESKFIFNAQYDDPNIGIGLLTYEPLSIKETGNSFKNNNDIATKSYLLGNYSWSMDKFPLKSFLALDNPYKFRKGFLSGKVNVNIQNIIKDNTNYTLDMNLKLNDYELFNLDSLYFKNSLLEIIGSYTQKQKVNDIDLYGSLNNAKFKIKASNTLSELLPNILDFSITSDEPHQVINLPYNINIYGLNSVTCTISKAKEYQYRNLGLEIHMDQGKIEFTNFPSIEVPYLKGVLANNKLNLKGNIKQNDSDLLFNVQGGVKLLKQPFTKIVQVLEVQNTSAIQTETLVFNTDLEGTAKSNKLLWSDLQVYYLALKKMWQNRIIYDLNMSWHGISLWNYSTFMKFLSNGKSHIQYNIDQFYYSPKSFVPLNVDLRQDYQGIELDIINSDMNMIKFDWNYNGGSSSFEVNSKVNLQDSYFIMKDILPTNIPIVSFDAISFQSTLKQTGARFSDQYLSKSYSGNIEFKNLILQDTILKNNTHKKWDIAKTNFHFNSSKGKTFNFVANNKNDNLNANVEWTEDNFKLKWLFDYSVIVK